MDGFDAFLTDSVPVSIDLREVATKWLESRLICGKRVYLETNTRTFHLSPGCAPQVIIMAFLKYKIEAYRNLVESPSINVDWKALGRSIQETFMAAGYFK